MTGILEITDLVKELCRLADVEYDSATLIEIEPNEVRFTGLLRNRHGSFYVDLATGEPASEITKSART